VDTSTSAVRRGIAIGVALTLVSLLLWWAIEDRADAAAPQALPAVAVQSAVNDDGLPPAPAAWFAKYEGIDGEAQDTAHPMWIQVESLQWGVEKRQGATGSSRRRGAAIVEDLVITMEYEKASTKLLEKCVKGEVIPKLELELTASYGETAETYLRYEMKNVSCSLYEVSGSADEGPPTVTIANNFEEIKVTYTEYNDEGTPMGNVETEFKVEKGE